MNNEMALRDPGAVERQTGSEDIVTYARWVVESGLFGRGITQAQAGLKMLIGRELGIQPLAAVRNIYVFEANGRPCVILDASLMGAMVRTSGRYDFEVVAHDDTGTELAMYRLTPAGGRTLLGKESFSLEDAKRRRLDQKEGPWKQGYTREMCYARAMSRLVDHYAPELLLGLSMPVVTQEAAEDMPMDHEQRKAIFASLRRFDMSDDERHAWASDVVGRPVASFAQGAPDPLTRGEAALLLSWLKEREEEALGLREPEVVQEAAEEPAGVSHREPSALRSAEPGDVAGEAPPGPAARDQAPVEASWSELGAGDEGEAVPPLADVRPADGAAGNRGAEGRRPSPTPDDPDDPEDLRSQARRNLDDVLALASVGRRSAMALALKRGAMASAGVADLDGLTDEQADGLTAIVTEKCLTGVAR